MKKYLIIGGSSGIGKEIVKQLKDSNKVYASYNHNEQENDTNVHYFPLNVMEEDMDWSVLPDKIDGLVYCPGSINLKPFSRIKPSAFEDDFKLQVVGAVRTIQAVLPKLKASENASIVLFSTVAVQLGFNFHSQVATSKGAIEGLTRALSAELAPNIRVNAIAPSLTNTPLAGKLLNTNEKIAANAQRHPLKKIGHPENIADMASFLLSDKSSWMTGQILHVDGGMSGIK